MRSLRHTLAACIPVALATFWCPAQPCAYWELFPNTGPTNRAEHTMAYHDRARHIVLFGGWADNSETWLWDGANWSLASTTLNPPPRIGAEMTYDAARMEVLLFGGRGDGSEILGDLWAWNGFDWIHHRFSTGPSPRFDHAMAYDHARQVTVLFGGYAGPGNRLGDTWIWNGQEWSLAATDGPSPRFGHAMAYDFNSQQIILFGGSTESGRVDETWAFDGAAWTLLTTEGPTNETYASMAYDHNLGGIVIRDGFGGRSTWLWDGQRWLELATNDGANRRYYPAMAYDAARGTTVLQGGTPPDFGSTFDDTGILHAALIVGHPQDAVVDQGQPATFRVDVRFTHPPMYQWRRNGQPLIDAGTISGSNTDTLFIDRAYKLDSGVYDCVVIADCGEIVSEPATLDVRALTIEVDASCPLGGPITVTWDDATPDGDVALLFAAGTGRVRLPNGSPCPDVALGLGSHHLQLVYQGPAGPEGHGFIHASAGPNTCGKFLQLVDLSTCQTSNVAPIN